MPTLRLLWTSIFIALALSCVVSAQDGPPVDAEERALIEARDALERPAESAADRRAWLIQAIGEASWLSSVDAGDLDVETFRYGGGLKAKRALSRDVFLSLQVGWEHSIYRLRGLDEALNVTRRKRTLHMEEANVSASLRIRQSPTWGWFVRANAAFVGEIGAPFEDAVKVGGIAGASWKVSDTWELQFGVGVFSRIEEDALIIPAISATWKPDEFWRVDIGFPKTGISYRDGRDWTYSLGARFDFRDYRLDERRPLDGAVLRDDAIIIELGARHEASRNLSYELNVGLPVWREISIDNDSGREIFDESADLGFVIRLELTWTF